MSRIHLGLFTWIGLALLSVPPMSGQPPQPAGRSDRFGLALPPHALARLETARLREAPSNVLSSTGRTVWVVFSADGKALLSGHERDSVRFWDPATGDELPPSALVPSGPDGIFALAPDRKTILVSSFRQPAQLYEVGTGKALRTLEATKEDSLRRAVFTPDGKTVAGVTGGGAVGLWDPATGKRTGTYRPEGTSALALSFAPDSKVMAAGCADGSLRFLDVVTGKEARLLEAHEEKVWAVAYRPDGKVLASYGSPNSVCLWDTATNKALARFAVANSIEYLALTPDGRMLACLEGQGVRLRELPSGRVLFAPQSRGRATRSLALSPDGRALAWAEDDPAIRMARLHNGRVERVWPEKLLPLGLAFTPDGKQLITVGDRVVRCWDAVTGTEVRRLPPHAHAFTRLAFAAEKGTLALAGAEGAVHWLTAGTGKTLAVFRGDKRPLEALTFSATGKHLATGHGASIRIWDGAGKEKAKLVGHTAVVTGLAFAPDGRLLASVSEDRTVCLWDVGAGVVRGRSPVQETRLACVAWSGDGRRLATGDWEGKVRLWAVAAAGKKWPLRPLHTLAAHADSVAAVAFAPGGKLLASAGWDHRVRLWDAATGKERRVLDGHRDEACSLAFSPDGGRLASGSRDHTVLIWDISDLR